MVIRVEAHIRAVPDPEIPVISIDDLGIVRDVVVNSADSSVWVTITPTYSGCPAMRAIERAIVDAAARDGFAAYVDTRLSPAWTTDWISESGRNALREFGIAPPDASAHMTGSGAHAAGGAVSLTLQRRSVACPVCGSTDTEELSRFGATACKALRRCLTCREPFEEFKPL
nr:1,2-phenylacetyl-CoA epoxidase subunit PaaD [Rudaeicoccus suwonensis]